MNKIDQLSIYKIYDLTNFETLLDTMLDTLLLDPNSF